MGDSVTLQNRAINFSRVNNPFLVPLQAFFVKGNRAFVQMPLLMKVEEWLASSECSSEDVARVLRDVLEGRRALHTNNVCQGCVNLESFLVEEVDGQFRGRLGFFPFSNPQCSKAQDMKLFENIVETLNFPNKDHTMTLSELTEELQRHNQRLLEAERMC